MRRYGLRILIAALAAVATVVPAALVSAEPVRSEQWYLDELRIPDAHKIATGKGVTVAVIDSGFDPKTPDMKGAVVCGKDFAVAFPAKCGWSDDDGHGSAMSSIIAAQGGGSGHAYGIAPGAKVMPLKVGGSQKAMAQAIRYAVSDDATVISISQSLTGTLDPNLGSAVRYAEDHDVVIVAAAGNVDVHGKTMAHPADIPGVTAVTGTDRAGEFWTGSARGSSAGISAPAEHVVSAGAPADTKTGYVHGTGTSASAAIVSGVVALVRERYPKLSADNVINRLIKTADDKGPAGRDDRYGYGLVDPVKALSATVPTVSANPLAVDAGKSAKPNAAGDSSSAKGPNNAVLLAVGIGVGLLVVIAVVVIAAVTRWRRRRGAVSTWPTHTDERV